MPVTVAHKLPAIDILKPEKVFLMASQRALHQDIRPLEIAIVNLMPTKIDTEVQFLRLLSNTPLQINVTLINMGDHISKNTPSEHLATFYKNSDEVLNEYFDGLIVTGAPLENVPFEEVDYWAELKRVLDWSRDHVYSTLFICWGVNAALYHFHGIEKRLSEEKIFGIYDIEVYKKSNHLFRGFDDVFKMPQSRYFLVDESDIANIGVEVLAGCKDTGPVIFSTPDERQIFVTGHLEYDDLTLDLEYTRDQGQGLETAIPINYYTDDDPKKAPIISWRTYAHQFFANWLNHCIYQQTPYDITKIGDPTLIASSLTSSCL